MRRSPARTAMGVAVLLVCSACDRVTHDMEEQPRYNPAQSSPLFADGQAERPPVPGGVVHARGDRAAVGSGRAEALAPIASDGSTALSVDDRGVLVARGQQRYAIYCLPCHGPGGQGDGEVVKRGFPAPRSLLEAAVKRRSDTDLDDLIAHGIGTMYPFDDRLDAADRQAVIAYLRQLQAGAAP